MVMPYRNRTNCTRYLTIYVGATATGVAPSFVSNPASCTVTSGSVATFTVVVAGTQPVTVDWYRTPPGGIRATLVSAGTATSATTWTYVTPNTVNSDTLSTFHATVRNPYGQAQSTPATLTVTAGTATGVTITVNPASVVKFVGDSVTFSCYATGDNPKTWTWYKTTSATPIAIAQNSTNSSNYSIPSLTLGDAASYYVVVENAVNSATSTSAILTVNPVQPAGDVVRDLTPMTLTLQPVTFDNFTSVSTFEYRRPTAGSNTLTNLEKSNGWSFSTSLGGILDTDPSTVGNITLTPGVTGPATTSAYYKLGTWAAASTATYAGITMLNVTVMGAAVASYAGVPGLITVTPYWGGSLRTPATFSSASLASLTWPQALGWNTGLHNIPADLEIRIGFTQNRNVLDERSANQGGTGGPLSTWISISNVYTLAQI